MDPVSSVMIRLSLIWLVLGFAIGSLMLLDASIPGLWRTWLSPGHVHMLVVGWFLQFALAVAIWLLPRKRTTGRPRGYPEGLAVIAAIGLNAGLGLRIVSEALDRAGHELPATTFLYAIASIAQFGAVVMFACNLWPRVAARPLRTQAGG